ncbi:MAG: DMT family transporter [Rhodospirillaceae bacterium]|nr:DMT family transporter [Rhodospirillaceae bacterium]MBT6608760.1 DMT family transporter [Rhodospirillaceae bacterium]
MLNRILTEPSLRGILCVLVAGATFSTSDMLIKTLSGDYPLHQIVFIRAIVALVIVLGLFMPLEGGYHNVRSARWKLHVFRGGCVVVANMSFFVGVAALPLAEATAIFFVAPLIITALSVPILGEKVGVRRWLSVMVGLVGVVIVIRPGSEVFQYAALAPVLAAFAYAFMQITARKLGGTERASTMAFYVQATFVLVCATSGLTIGDGRFAEAVDSPTLLFLLRAWTVPSQFDGGVMLAVGVLSAFGSYLISQGYRLAEATTAAPFEYIVLPMAIMWGVIVFGDWPDAIALLGILLIVASGLYAFWRENVRGVGVAADHPFPRNR